MRLPRRLVAALALVTAGLILAATASATSESRTPTLRAKVRAIGSEVRDLERKVELMELSAARYADWQACGHGVPVSEYGDPDRQSGYLYDERDGTGLGYRPALAIDRSDWDDPDYMFLAFVGGDRPGRSCQDEPGEGVD